MSILLTTLSTALRNLLLPWIGSLLVLAIVLSGTPSSLETEVQNQAAASRSLWLHLPAMLLSLTTIATILEAWPLFGRDRDGTRLLFRVAAGPLKGCGAACAGGLIALAIALTSTSIAYTFALDPADRTREVQAIVTIPSTVQRAELNNSQTSLSFRLPAAGFRRLRLRPLISAVDSKLSLRLDGRPIGPKTIPVDSGRWCEVELGAQQGELLEIRSAVANDRFLFQQDTVEVVLDTKYPAWLNSIWALLTYLFPASLACGLICVARRSLSLPIAIIAGFGLILACTVGDLTPNASAFAAHARGRWILSEGLGLWSLTTLSFGAAALALAASARGRDRT